MSNNAQFEVEKTKEDFLREELRATRKLLVNLMERGVALMVAVELILYYIRQDMTAHLRELGRLGPDEVMPLGLYAVGTLLLLVIAFNFSRYTSRIAHHYTVYRLQLISLTPTFSGIAESIEAHRPVQQYVYLALPMFDVAVWLAYYAAGLGDGVSRLVW
jgi:hypothetical protein